MNQRHPNKPCAGLEHIPTILPVEGEVETSFEKLGFLPAARGRPSKGMTIYAPPGAPVCATADGTVKALRCCRPFGWYILIDHHNGLITKYTHIGKITVRLNSRVTKGQVIGTLNNEANTKHHHSPLFASELPREIVNECLHYEIWLHKTPVSPDFCLVAGSELH